jgi:single-strand DNA-binding protein
MSVNKAILVGRLGRDPETRYTSGGQAVCNFTMATDETYKDRNGERQKRTEWHRIVVWGKQAEIAQQYLHKGSLIFLEGRIQTRQWDDREGQKRTTVEIVANTFRMLGGRGEGGGAAGASAGAGAGDAEPQAAAGGGCGRDALHGNFRRRYSLLDRSRKAHPQKPRACTRRRGKEKKILRRPPRRMSQDKDPPLKTKGGAPVKAKNLQPAGAVEKRGFFVRQGG